MNIIGSIVDILLLTLISGLVIWIVGKLKLGMTVSGFGPAFLAAIVIAVVSWIITWILNLLGISTGGGIIGAIVNLLIAAGVLLFAGKWVKGLAVKGFVGAIIAAIAIAVVAWLVGLGLGLLM
jgi:putative membrane protein